MRLVLGKKEKHCHFCRENIKELDYKNVELLRKYISSYAKILPRRRTGTCSKHQRMLSTTIKRSRYMALMPYVLR